ncbi:hypothetical protein LLH06_17605 [Mucilaginibacter daejeonensis]|uniref:hypothetical protein n=1 Tax=Mucilaginibacter daejeonensis TaxID=398049 RepID=UPI001D176589|nr:hypothetical protein [Mucilaginibacter daejeonensis]UEG52764.1 hypothetical protein LLH06_17605 [Mucilaginibacter daejeonensis]
MYNGLELFSNEQATGVANLLLSIYQHFHFNYPKFYKMDNLSKLGWLASEVLLKDIDLRNDHQPEEVGMVLANANSSLDNDLRYYNTIDDVPSPAVFVYTLPNIVIGEICIRNNIKGEHSFFIQPAFDANFIHEQVSYLLDHDILNTCICGWVDVLGDQYKAALYLVEKQDRVSSMPFTPQHMDRLFNTKNS